MKRQAGIAPHSMFLGNGKRQKTTGHPIAYNDDASSDAGSEPLGYDNDAKMEDSSSPYTYSGST